MKIKMKIKMRIKIEIGVIGKVHVNSVSTPSLSNRDTGKVKERIEERITKGKGELNIVLRDAWRCLEMIVDVFEE